MAKHLEPEELAELHARIRKAEENATQIAKATKTTPPTVLRNARLLGVTLPRGKRGPEMGRKGPRLRRVEAELDSLRDDVRELLRCLVLPPETPGRRQQIQKAVDVLHRAVE